MSNVAKASAGPGVFSPGGRLTEYLAVAGALGIAAIATVWFLPPITNAVAVSSMVCGAVLYLIAHAVRAIRLAMLASPLLGVSARTTAALHFATAPVSLLLPFKLGELVRLHQLYVVGKSAPSAVVVLLLDRMFDALFLLPVILLVVSATGWFEVSHVLLMLTLVAAVLPLVAVVLGPAMFGAIQDYIVLHHWNPRSLRLLPFVSVLRDTTERGREAIRGQWPQLALLSVVIWICELALVGLLIITDAALSLVALSETLLAKLNVSWFASDGPRSVDLGTTTAQAALTPEIVAIVGLLALLLVWPFAVAVYMRRRRHEPLRRQRQLVDMRRA